MIGFIFGCFCIFSFILGKTYGKSKGYEETLENPRKAKELLERLEKFEELRERVEKFKEKYRHRSKE